MSLFTEYEFSKCVKRYNGDRHAIKFNCRDQFPGNELCTVQWLERY